MMTVLASSCSVSSAVVIALVGVALIDEVGVATVGTTVLVVAVGEGVDAVTGPVKEYHS